MAEKLREKSRYVDAANPNYFYDLKRASSKDGTSALDISGAKKNDVAHHSWNKALRRKMMNQSSARSIKNQSETGKAMSIMDHTML